MKIRLQDLSRAEMLNSQYDIAFFGLGYEPRCTYVSKLIDIRNVHETIILSFNESAQNKSRLLSSDILQKKWASKLSIVNLEHSHIHEVYAVLNNKLSKIDKDEIFLMVDYSSMSRNWYAAILNYCLKVCTKKITIDLIYSSAEYPKNEEFLNFELGDVKILPGCEGSSITKKKKCAIFMLGFDKIGPQSFFNLLEPDLTFGIIASPGSLPDYEVMAETINKEFIEHQLSDGKNLLKLPISSLSVTFENLCQIIQPLKYEYNISIIQFGPKPHIIASTLAGLFFENVTCIYSEYSRSNPFNIQPNGELVMTRITAK
ncbi:hypothetical protein AAIG28_13480 [Citrobacter freundii]|uniref:hypothetical protein n=3 Tax=Citrobacter freundii TaxID=546 RepID=UPI0013970222|nr:hypothetical protein [Citrobacter freundii]EGT0634460.1 hypothetical protein [Citrobacter freundii]EKX5680832.1 hypothetical protein [Citrobacter freundii]ELN4553707.1 hypothetical protein [Citrobacter freundii]MDK8077588.1 hypothetical protein [Citrobacter freundii]MDK8589833.1 hypothetical protein [Citrobacter freundii]